MALQTTTKLTYDDYVLIPDDGRRHEIIDGEHYVNPAPNVRHQRVLRRVFLAVATFVEEYDLGEVFFSPIDVVFSQHNVVQPDLIFVRKENTGELHGAFVKIAPDLVIEVLSKSTRTHDKVRKLKVYDTFNVAEYWIVDPENDLVSIYRRSDANLALVEKVDFDGTIDSPLFPGFTLAARTVFA